MIKSRRLSSLRHFWLGVDETMEEHVIPADPLRWRVVLSDCQMVSMSGLGVLFHKLISLKEVVPSDAAFWFPYSHGYYEFGLCIYSREDHWEDDIICKF
jgi:hypothetical protein